MIRHVVLIEWKPDTTLADIAHVAAGLLELPAIISSIRTYSVGSDLALGDGRADFAVVADFDDAEGWRAYDTHAAHIAVRSERMAPHIATRTFIQFAL